MKKNLIAVLLLCGGLHAHAAVSFPSANTQWLLRSGNGDARPSYYVIGMNIGDTLIKGIAYHKLYRSLDDRLLDEREFIGGLREDVLQRIYFCDAATGTERMLYDFSVAVGDTVRDASGYPHAIVSSIDSVTVSGATRKRINFSLVSSSTVWAGGSWIEGIGNSSLGGLLGDAMAQPTCDCATNTVCMIVDGATVYHNSSYNSVDCGMPLNVDVFQDIATTTNVFPNPATGTATLRIAGNEEFQTLTIYNMAGAVVQREQINGRNDIPVGSDFAPGTYLYRLAGGADGAATAGRFTVQ